MPDPVYDSRTTRFALPYLFAGQAQKETFVNEAAARIDALLHRAVEGTLSAPPATPADGQCWLVGSAPTGDWAGHGDHLAAREAGAWFFFPPLDGMQVLDRSSGQIVHYKGGWRRPARPAAPSAGAVVDTEARAALANLVTALTEAGILPPN